MQKKSFNTPDETKSLPKTKLEVIKIGNLTLIRNTFESGWKWSEHVKPTVNTDSCQAHHLIYMISGRFSAVMDDGTEIETAPGDIVEIPPGHDAWVIGDQPVVGIDIASAIS